MIDIVERLRKGIEWTGPTQDDTGQTENLMDEAADEIERLREWNREIALNAREFAADNERLRAALLPFASIKADVGDGFSGLPDMVIIRIEASVRELKAARAALEGSDD